MLSVSEAQARVLAPISPTGCEWLGLHDARDRTLAQDLISRRDQPPIDVSAMDGFAVRAADCAPGSPLVMVGEIPAGSDPGQAIGPGQCKRIFTGAAIPGGADAVLIQENAEQRDELIAPQTTLSPGQFVRPRGLDFTAGRLGARSGTQITPLTIGLAASFGHSWLPVRRKPRVGLLATGDELARPGDPLAPTSIISSNTATLMAMLERWGAQPVDLGIARDEPDSLLACLDQSDRFDLIVTSGGASVGQYDLIRSVLGDCGLELDFWKIAMRPGKPLIFGAYRGVPFLGLPGNPVSASVCAIMFLRPMIMAMLGREPRVPVRSGILAGALRANDVREDYLRANLTVRHDATLVRPADRQDSSMFWTLANAEALAVRPPFEGALTDGDPINFIALADVLGI